MVLRNNLLFIKKYIHLYFALTFINVILLIFGITLNEFLTNIFGKTITGLVVFILLIIAVLNLIFSVKYINSIAVNSNIFSFLTIDYE
jgi:hypothetical protein